MKHVKLFEQFLRESAFVDMVCSHLTLVLNESVDNWTIRKSVNHMLKSSDSHPYFGKLKESDALEAAIQLANLCLEFAEKGQMDEAMNLDTDHWKQVIEELQKKKQYFINEGKPKGAPDWHDSDAPDAEGRFKELGIKDLAAWLIKTRKKDLKKITGSLNQQIVFNRNDDPEYAKKMEKVRIEVYKQLGREDLLDKK